MLQLAIIALGAVLISVLTLPTTPIAQYYPHYTLLYNPSPQHTATTLQFGSLPSFTPPSTSAFPNFPPPTSTSTSPSSFISPTLTPKDRLSRTFEPTIFNAGSESSSLNAALKYYSDEELRILREFNELTVEKMALDGSPRSLSDNNMKTYYNTLSERLDNLSTALSLTTGEQDKIDISSFGRDLIPASTATDLPSNVNFTPNITQPSPPNIPSKDDMPDPSILMNPEVQGKIKDNLQDFTNILGDLKTVFSPSPSTSNMISSIANNAPRGGSGGGLPLLDKLFR